MKDSSISILKLPSEKSRNWKESLFIQLSQIESKELDIDCQNWALNYRDIQYISHLTQKAGLTINRFLSNISETIISAAALGYSTQLILNNQNFSSIDQTTSSKDPHSELLFHKGTLRSGEHLETDGDVLIFGNVNPGAQVSADGDVLIWGRLLGTAHAGKSGNKSSKIVALELRPLQLRIAEQVARGPEDKPQPGLAEEAIIQSGQIVIRPVRTGNSLNRIVS